MHILLLAYTCDSADCLHLLVNVNKIKTKCIMGQFKTRETYNRRRGVLLTTLLFHHGSVIIVLFAEVKLIASPPHCMDIIWGSN